MKILFLSDDFPPLSFGGAGIATYRMAKKLQERGHEVRVFSTTQDINKVCHKDYQGVPVSFNFIDYNTRFSVWWGMYNHLSLRLLQRVLEDFKPDVVHAHNVHGYISYASLKLSKKLAGKVFLTAHDTNIFYTDKYYEYINASNVNVQTDFNYKLSNTAKLKQIKTNLNPFRRIIIKHYLKSVDKIFAVSCNLKTALNQNGINNVDVIRNAIDIQSTDSFDYSGDIFRQKFNIPLDRKIILVAGRFNTLKGGRLLLPYIKEIKKQEDNFILIFAGQKNNLAQSVIGQAQAEGLDNHLLFTGWLEENEMNAIYFAVDIIIVPSIYLDVFNLTNIEAMVHKKPVVGTCFGGTPEIVVDGVTGYIVNPYNVKQTADRIIDLLVDQAKAQQFGLAGYQRVKEHFSLDKQVDQLIDYYQA